MKGKFTGLLIVAMFLLSVFAGAVSALDIHALNVKPYDETSTPALDQVLVTGTESHTWTNTDGSKSHTFYLPHGTYDIIVKKTGYNDFVYKGAIIDDTNNKDVNGNYYFNVYYQLIKSTTTPPSDGGNNVPIITSTAITTATVNIQYKYDVEASDADGDVLTYSLTQNPQGMTIDVTTGLITWTPSQAGNFDVKVKVLDGKGGSPEQSFTIVVSLTPPVLMTIKSLDFKDEVKPNEEVEFTVELKNTWGADAFDVNVNLAIKGIDDGADLSEDIDFGTIDNKDVEEKSVKLKIPLDADDKKYNVVATVTWEDENGKAFPESSSVTKTDTIEVVRAEHDVAVTSVQFEDLTLEVGEDSQVSISLANIGKDDETVKLTVKSAVLGLDVTSPEFQLRESKATTQYVPLTITKDVKEGKYPISITAYFGSGDSTTQTAVLTIKPKAAPQVQEPVTITPVVTTVQQETEARQMPGVGVWALIALVLIAAVLAGVITTRTKPQVIVEKKRGGK